MRSAFCTIFMSALECTGDLGKVGVMIIDNVDENSLLTFFVYEAPYI